MSELRQNLCSKEWVVIAPHRGRKPNALKSKVVIAPEPVDAYDANCPFCPGNEAKFQIAETMRLSQAEGGWSVRTIENKYKILNSFDSCPAIAESFEKEGIYHKLKACGSHELVIECREHHRTIMDFSIEDLKDIFWAAWQRYLDFKKNPNNLITIIFKNYGALSGQTQHHSHAQIVGSRVVPYYLRSLMHESEKHFDSFGTCVFCDMIQFEIKEAKRIVYQNESYVALVPFAAGAEHETWILPKIHSAGWDSLDDKKISGLADILQTVFKKFQFLIEDPDFNFMVRLPPYPLTNVPFFHWHIQLLPRTKIIGGFEYGTRIQVNTILPEESAKLLRECADC